MDNFKSLLFDLENHLKMINAPIVNLFNKGANRTQIIDFFKIYFKENIPEEILDIYCWHNGANEKKKQNTIQYHIVPDFAISPLSLIKEEYEHGTYYNFLQKKMIPLFYSGFGEYLVVNLTEANKNIQKAPLYWVGSSIPGTQPYSIIYPDIYSMFKFVIMGIDKKFILVDNKYHYLSYSEDKIYSIAKKFYPNLEYWKSTYGL